MREAGQPLIQHTLLGRDSLPLASPQSVPREQQPALHQISDGLGPAGVVVDKRKQSCEESHIQINEKTSNKRMKPDTKRRLACPYYKRDPERHGYKGACSGPGWLTVARLKSHVLPRFRCPRCYLNLERSDALAAHARTSSPCLIIEHDPDDGFGEEVKEALKDLKVSNDIPEKWVDIYRLLFPTDQTIPSPYHEHAHRHNCEIQERKGCLRGYKEYICKEFSPTLREELKSEISVELGIFEERIKERAVDVFHNLATRILNRYQMENKTDPLGAPPRNLDGVEDEGLLGQDADTTGAAGMDGIDWFLGFNDVGVDSTDVNLPVWLHIGELVDGEQPVFHEG
ncbi:hypothetical protein S7711_01327 [Stachybotrys chartarum IBT 7711]|uniref:C2H2-type domain-containing protein n=1 Tax=Stachybotrys chartarum (strain CBS 109288 / IBT 7711) TaxID=1280523 RepID=A0A084BBQ1_STACB|nr:hypothetical protein S7711_01327 [Stachybotrys chartarum IBT 7711]